MDKNSQIRGWDYRHAPQTGAIFIDNVNLKKTNALRFKYLQRQPALPNLQKGFEPMVLPALSRLLSSEKKRRRSCASLREVKFNWKISRDDINSLKFLTGSVISGLTSRETIILRVFLRHVQVNNFKKQSDLEQGRLQPKARCVKNVYDLVWTMKGGTSNSSLHFFFAEDNKKSAWKYLFSTLILQSPWLKTETLDIFFCIYMALTTKNVALFFP